MDAKALEDFYNYINSVIVRQDSYVTTWSKDNMRDLAQTLNFMRSKGLKCDKGEVDEGGFYNVVITKK